MKTISIAGCTFLLLLFTISCKTENKALTAYKAWEFDTAVMHKLPLYDSLATALFKKITLIHQQIHDDDAYHAFRYMPASTETEVFKKMPDAIGHEADSVFHRIGHEHIFAFDVFKDSTIKIFIRKSTLPGGVLLEETLSYFPVPGHITHREYPEKDSILNQHWQYRARFDNPGLF